MNLLGRVRPYCCSCGAHDFLTPSMNLRAWLRASRCVLEQSASQPAFATAQTVSLWICKLKWSRCAAFVLGMQITQHSVAAAAIQPVTHIEIEEVAMTLCPIAIAVSCRKCPIVSVCPVKTVIGDYVAPTRSKPVPEKPKRK